MKTKIFNGIMMLFIIPTWIMIMLITVMGAEYWITGGTKSLWTPMILGHFNEKWLFFIGISSIICLSFVMTKCMTDIRHGVRIDEIEKERDNLHREKMETRAIRDKYNSMIEHLVVEYKEKISNKEIEKVQ